MSREQHQFLNKYLPGRTPAEMKALAPLLRKLVTADGQLSRITQGPRPSTDRGRMGRAERNLKALVAMRELEEKIVEKMSELAVARSKLLPPDAESITMPNRGEHDHGLDRYKIHAIAPSGSVYLGGCASLGDAFDRRAWFERQMTSK